MTPTTEMARLYHDEHLSLAEVGAHFGMTRQAVQQRFTRAGVSRRPRRVFTDEQLAERRRAQQRDYNRRTRAADPEPNRAAVREWARANPERRRAQQRKAYRENPERAAAHHRRWRLANLPKAAERSRRRRARQRAATVVPFTAEQLAARLSMFAGCWMCGAPATEIDHVKPLAAGGPHMLANLRPACGPCNAAKGARWPLRLTLMSLRCGMATDERHRCAAVACDELVPLRHLFCAHHWALVPQYLRERLMGSFRFGQEHGKAKASTEWIEAADEAIAAVVELETAA